MSKREEFVDKYLTLCTKYGYYVGNSSPYSEVRIYEIMTLGRVFVHEDELFQEHVEECLEDIK